MRTPLCLFQPHSQQQRPNPCPNRKQPTGREKQRENRGQVLVIFGLALVALLLFAGLAVDAGVVYVSYGHLKRSVDSAAVAAANSFKRNETLERMHESAAEVLQMNRVDMSHVNLQVYTCDMDETPGRDASLQTTAPNFYLRCPDTAGGENARKLVYIRANQHTPFFFLSLIGFSGIDLYTDATAEAAAVDLLLVFDTSESMGMSTTNIPSGYNCKTSGCEPDKTTADANGIYGCNTYPWDSPYSCRPLKEAKEAAINLVENYLYDGFDRVGIVTFDTSAIHIPIAVSSPSPHTEDFSGDLTAVVETIKNIKLHDDPPVAQLRPSWLFANVPTIGNRSYFGAFNPINPDDRDGDGRDADPLLPCSDPDNDGWDPAATGPTGGAPGWLSGATGAPCDDENKLDAFDWNKDGQINDTDDTELRAWLSGANWNGIPRSTALLSTCTGCGIRVGSNHLKLHGRPGSLWVMILLSDGQVNMSDTGNDGLIGPGYTPDTSNNVSNLMPNGYCTGGWNKTFWYNGIMDGNAVQPCVDLTTSSTQRVCIDPSQTTCPPSTQYQSPATTTILNNSYSPDDYARDMADSAALLKSTNAFEPIGNDITVFTIGLGVNDRGEDLLRYIANVGDDGDRTNPPTCGPTQSCGNYYYAVTGNDLLPIFEKIASRIYTRITD